MSAAASHEGGARASHWADIGENTFVFGILAIYWFDRILGRRLARVAMYPVVLVYVLASAAARRASRTYLSNLQGKYEVLGRTPNFLHVFRHFFEFAETILDKVVAISGRYDLARISMSGVSLLEALDARSQGAILVTAHIGCLELCQAVAERSGRRLTVLVHTKHAERFNRLLVRMNPESKVQLLQVTELDSAMAVDLSSRIDKGELVAIAGDRVPVKSERVSALQTSSATTQIDFLNRPASFPTGAYVLASAMKCPLIMLSCVRSASGHHIAFDELASRVELPRGKRQEALRMYASSFASHLEKIVAGHPYQWFNFYDFWASPVDEKATYAS